MLRTVKYIFRPLSRLGIQRKPIQWVKLEPSYGNIVNPTWFPMQEKLKLTGLSICNPKRIISGGTGNAQTPQDDNEPVLNLMKMDNSEKEQPPSDVTTVLIESETKPSGTPRKVIYGMSRNLKQFAIGLCPCFNVKINQNQFTPVKFIVMVAIFIFILISIVYVTYYNFINM